MSGGYQIKKSLRFNSADSAYISRTFGSTGNRKTWTWSGWVKRSALSTAQVLLHTGTTNGNYFTIYIADDNSLTLGVWAGPFVSTTAVFRDVSAWYHVMVVMDTTQATVNDRVKIYINGTQHTSWKTNTISTYYSQNTDTPVNQIQQHTVSSRNPYAADSFLNAYLAEFNFIDGQALTPSSFGKVDSATGQWIPKKYSGTYGTNGFYLPFDDSTSTTTLGYDRSGNSNNWTLTNFSVVAGTNNDWMDDTPTNNFATLNPLQIYSAADGIKSTVTSDGALQIPTVGVQTWGGSTFTISTGKWYAEFVFVVGTDATVGIYPSPMPTSSYFYQVSGAKTYYTSGAVWAPYPTVVQNYSAWTTGDVIGVAVDMDNGKLWFRKNGVWQGSGDPAAGTLPAVSGLSGEFMIGGGQGSSGSVTANFGQRAFAYTPPTGFKSLCTKNLTTPVIKKPNQYFNTITWTGNDVGTTRSFTGVGFSPNLVWVKCRSTAYYHSIYDSVRGAGNNSELISNTTGAEGAGNQSEYDWLSSFDADGFTSTYGGVNARAYFNQLNQTYVGWNWKESAASGFDVVMYTGTTGAQTINHSLGAVPAMIITKSRTGTGNWAVYHKDANATPQNGSVWLNVSNAWTSNSVLWNNTLPTSTQFTVGSNNTDSNYSGTTMVAYCFAEVPGFSKIGKYTGNGSTDGPFVYCGFKPAYVMVKRTDVADNWLVRDATRDTRNVVSGKNLFPNTGGAEDTFAHDVDFLSNGFKIRGTNAVQNASGGSYIFMAFAEAPFKYSTAR